MLEIISGVHFHKEFKCTDAKGRIQAMYNVLKVRGQVDVDLVMTVDPSAPVVAMIDTGRWGAKCPDCPGAEYVEFGDPVFWCFSCGNVSVGGKLRPVQFPTAQEVEEIELLLTERPISVHKGLTKPSRVLSSQPLGNLRREWHAGVDTVAKLKAANRKEGLEYDPKKIKEKREKVK